MVPIYYETRFLNNKNHEKCWEKMDIISREFNCLTNDSKAFCIFQLVDANLIPMDLWISYLELGFVRKKWQNIRCLRIKVYNFWIQETLWYLCMWLAPCHMPNGLKKSLRQQNKTRIHLRLIINIIKQVITVTHLSILSDFWVSRIKIDHSQNILICSRI